MDLVTSRSHLVRFLDSTVDRHTLGLVYGRRRIGKSTLLESVTVERKGFYWEATRGEVAVHLARLGDALGRYLGTGRIALGDWNDAMERLLQLGTESSTPVVLDEFGYLIEADSTLPSVVARALGPAAQRTNPGQARLVLCGSAVAMMRTLTAGEAPLRGRAGIELVMQPLDFRGARGRIGDSTDLHLAVRVFSVIGGVIGYATDMVDHDLPTSKDDFGRWVSDRVLSPAATLHHEATTLLAEDPSLSGASPALHHSILGAIANGAVTAGTIANKLRRSVSNLDPALKRLIAAGLVLRHEDPIRSQRPLYALSDPLLQFHYAVLEPHAALLRDRNPRATWDRTLVTTFDARVRGPVFEELARTWTRRYADPTTLGGMPGHVGPSVATIDGREHQLDIVVAADDLGVVPADRTVLAIGEAKAGEVVERRHLLRLEQARSALGTRAAQARLLFFGSAFSTDVEAHAATRADVELINLDRLYNGA
jgi:AAA+ ATPase superfamily predicted ATPase